MEGLILIFFVYMIFQILGGRKKTGPKTRRRPSKGLADPASTVPDDKVQDEWTDLAARLKSMSNGQIALQPKKRATMQAPLKTSKAAQRSGTRSQAAALKSREITDQNASRRSDWGQRAGPGLLSTRNALIAIAITLVLYLFLSIATQGFA